MNEVCSSKILGGKHASLLDVDSQKEHVQFDVLNGSSLPFLRFTEARKLKTKRNIKVDLRFTPNVPDMDYKLRVSAKTSIPPIQMPR